MAISPQPTIRVRAMNLDLRVSKTKIIFVMHWTHSEALSSTWPVHGRGVSEAHTSASLKLFTCSEVIYSQVSH